MTKLKRPKTTYIFLTREGPLLTEHEQDELARLVAVMIFRHLRYKKEIPMLSINEEKDHE
jgi:hypothetical protein